MENLEKKVVRTGWVKWEPSIEEWAIFSVEPFVPNYIDIKENEYLLVYTKEEDKEKLVGQYCYENGKLRKFGRPTIKYRGKDSKKALTPRNDEQICAFDLMKDTSKTVKVLLGNYGAGKSLLLISEALELLENHKIERIVWIRNNIQVEDTGSMGALPGDEFEKLLPWLGPMIDHVGDVEVKQMVVRGELQVLALGYARGRNIKNSVIICSEAENLTMKQIKLIIGRVAEGSMVWFDGDVRQRDGRAFKKAKGLERMIEKFTGQELFGYVYLPKTERSETAQLADLLDDDE